MRRSRNTPCRDLRESRDEPDFQNEFNGAAAIDWPGQHSLARKFEYRIPLEFLARCPPPGERATPVLEYSIVR